MARAADCSRIASHAVTDLLCPCVLDLKNRHVSFHAVTHGDLGCIFAQKGDEIDVEYGNDVLGVLLGEGQEGDRQ